MARGAQRVRYLRAHGDGGERHAGGERLGYRYYVGDDAEMLYREPFARAPHTLLHLV